MVRWTVSLCVLLSFAGGVFAQPRPELCLPDADGDGHPLFGNPQIRPGFEVNASGQVVVSDATTVAFADLDGDGDLDAAVTNIQWRFLNTRVYSVTVLINRGDGVFDPPVEYQAGHEPAHVIIADVDGDASPDLAVANASGDSVSILLNNGDGTFAPDVKHVVGQMPRSLVSADFDGDGDIDIATLNTISNDVSVLLNTGGGSFEAERRIAVGNVSQRGRANMTFPVPGPFLGCGDLNGDGKADLAVPAERRIRLLLGDGAAGFTVSASELRVVGGFAYDIKIGDLDRDGDADIALVNTDPFAVEALNVLINRGGGAFDPPVAYDMRTQPSPGAVYFTTSLAMDDLDHDGDLDIVVGYHDRQVVSVLRNNADGSFAAKETYPVHPGPWFVAWADVSGDGATDLAVLATSGRSKLAILLNDGNGDLITQEETPPRFWAPTTFPWISPNSVASADLDGDGDQDLAVSIGASEDPASVIVMLNDGDGVFDPVVPYTLGPVGESFAVHVAVADLNGDKIPDLAVADLISSARNEDGKVWVLLGLGGGTFVPAVPYQLDGSYPRHIAPGDLDGDGDTDLAVWTSQFYPGNNTTPVDRRVVIMLNDGAGVFQIASEHTIGSAEWLLPLGTVAVGDLDGDGDLDLAATMSPRVLPPVLVEGTLAVFLNDGNASFSPHLIRRVGPQPVSVTMFDAEGDGDLDLALGHNHRHPTEYLLDEPIATILFNNGKAAFPTEQLYTDQFSHDNGRMTIADVDGDGDPDLVHQDIGSVHVQLNDGQGRFEPGARYGTGDVPLSAAVADFDGDGRADIVTANSSDHNVTLLRNLDCRRCYPDCDQSTGIGTLDIFDYLCFQHRFVNQDPYACDCDTSTGPGVCDLLDFLCFQKAFLAGCP